MATFTLWDLLAIIGLAAIVALSSAMVVLAFVAIKEGIAKLKWKYKYKHRFDKSPTAKCYCRDCKHHGSETNQCYRFGETTKEYRCTADNWFCWEAEPREKDKED